MFHRAIDLKFLDGTTMVVRFQDGYVKRYDMSTLFGETPEYRALTDRSFFTSGKLMGPYMIVWNDDIDIDTATVYEDGATVGFDPIPPERLAISDTMEDARAEADMSWDELAALTGIDSSTLCRIERCLQTPTEAMLNRIGDALHCQFPVLAEIPAHA